MNPLVLIVGRLATEAKGVRGEPFAAGRRYFESVARAGGMPLMLPPIPSLVHDIPDLLRQVDAETGRPLLQLAHPEEVANVAFSADGTRLLTWTLVHGFSQRDVARLWDVETGALLTHFDNGDVTETRAECDPIGGDGRRREDVTIAGERGQVLK